MVWIAITEDERKAIEDIEATGSDRATVIVAAAIVEERLATAIKSKLHSDKEIVSHIFRVSGPLGSFSAKIDLGFLMGLYGKEAHSDLDTIKEIRNEFAHRLRSTNFNSQRVHDLCKNIKAADSNFEIAPVRNAKKSGRFKKQKMFEALDDRSPTYMRERYVRASQVFVVRLSLFTRTRRPKAPHF